MKSLWCADLKIIFVLSSYENVFRLDGFHSEKNVHLPSKITSSIPEDDVISIGSVSDANEYFEGDNIIIEIIKMLKIILKFIHVKFF